MFGLPLIDPRLMSDDDLRELSACVAGGALLDGGLARQLLDHATGLRAALDAQTALCARQRELLGAIEKLSRGEVAP